MIDINRVILIGRLTRDAELKSIASGLTVCKFSIAVNRHRKNGDQWEEEANFFDVTVWGRSGEVLHQYLVKGKMVAVDGELRQDRWQQDGQNRSKVEIIANNLQLLGGNPGSGSAGGESRGTAPSSGNGYSGNVQNGASVNKGNRAPAEDHFADDIPF